MSELDKSQYCASCEIFARQLSEMQALLKVKDEALSFCSKNFGGLAMLEQEEICEKALAQISGTDALDKMLEAEREACAAICDRFGERNIHPNEWASAIRAIP